jgi:hypothetical protein
MKKMINRMFMVAAGLFLLVTATWAQKSSTEKADKLIFLNGTTKEGKVLAFVEEKVRFVHSGETLNYEFPKKEIEKIEYASGRTEVITERKVLAIPPVEVISKNRVAVIPVQYMGNGRADNKEDMSYYLQEIVISFLIRSAAELKFRDAAEVNAVLLKNGISDSSIRKYTPKELAVLLNVEYIIMGTVLQDNGKQVSNAAGNKTRKQNTWDDGDYKRRENYQQTVVTSQMVETQVSLSIYNETGEMIYSKSRHSILSEQDAYKNAIHYLLKRTPLYKR